MSLKIESSFKFIFLTKKVLSFGTYSFLLFSIDGNWAKQVWACTRVLIMYNISFSSEKDDIIVQMRNIQYHLVRYTMRNTKNLIKLPKTWIGVARNVCKFQSKTFFLLVWYKLRYYLCKTSMQHRHSIVRSQKLGRHCQGQKIIWRTLKKKKLTKQEKWICMQIEKQWKECLTCFKWWNFQGNDKEIYRK